MNGVLLQIEFGPYGLLDRVWEFHNMACRLHGWEYRTLRFPPADLATGTFLRWPVLRDLNAKLKPGTRFAYLDSDAVWQRPRVALSPDLAGFGVGLVRQASNCRENAGAAYFEAGAKAGAFLELCEAESRVVPGFNPGDREASLAAERLGAAELDPAWNNWGRALGERHLLPVVQAYHGGPFAAKEAGVIEAVAQGRAQLGAG